MAARKRWESALEKRLGDLESDEIVILLRRITVLRYLHHVESELRLEVRGMIFRILDGMPYFARSLDIGGRRNSLRLDGRRCRKHSAQERQGEGVLVRNPDSAGAAPGRNHRCERSAANAEFTLPKG